MEKKHIDTLRKFFTILNAAFEFQRTIMTALGHVPHTTAIEMLHKMALQELDKPEPNAAFLDGVLFQMEKLVEQTANSGEEKN